jgi:hypothetical protein
LFHFHAHIRVVKEWLPPLKGIFHTLVMVSGVFLPRRTSKKTLFRTSRNNGAVVATTSISVYARSPWFLIRSPPPRHRRRNDGAWNADTPPGIRLSHVGSGKFPGKSTGKPHISWENPCSGEDLFPFN